MLLAIDTSTRLASVALYAAGVVRGEHTWWADQNHTAELWPQIMGLLQQEGIAPRQLTGIVVAIGPGSFNGLRVGLSAAKGLAWSLGLPLVGVCTLEAIAYQHSLLRMPIRPVLPAGRGEVNTALYRHLFRRWRQLEAPRLATLDQLCAETERRTLFCGELEAAQVETLRQSLGRRVVIAPPAAAPRRAAFLAELGAQRLAAAAADDPVTLQPIYLRHAVSG